MGDISHRWRAAYKALGDKIRGYTGKTDKMTVETAPDEVDLVYAAGVAAGSNSGGGEAPPSSGSEAYEAFVKGMAEKDSDTGLTLTADMLQGVEKISSYAFQRITFKEISLPDSVKRIHQNAFDQPTSQHVTCRLDLGSVERVDELAFRGQRISNIYLPDTLTSLGSTAFGGSGVEDLRISPNLSVISSSAFYDCRFPSDYRLLIPKSVTEIRTEAFGTNSNLNITFHVDFEEGSNIRLIDDNAFAYATLLSISIPASVELLGSDPITTTGGRSLAKTINNLVFEKRENTVPLAIGHNVLTSVLSKTVDVVLPNGTWAIGDKNFYEGTSSSSLLPRRTIEVPSTLIKASRDAFHIYGDRASDKDYGGLVFNFKDGMAFLGNPDNPYVCLANGSDADSTDVNIPADTVCIKDYAFGVNGHWSGAGKRLTSVTFEEGSKLLGIGEKAFQSCTFTTFKVPSSVVYLGKYAFQECAKLTSLEIPGTRFDQYGRSIPWEYGDPNDLSGPLGTFFSDTTSTGIVSWTQQIYRHSSGSFTSGTFRGPSSLSEVIVTRGDVAHGFFSGVTDLMRVEVLSDCERVEARAFYNCKKLNSFEYSGNLKHIGESAFYYCSMLSTLNIPDTLETLGKNAFECTGLSELTIPEKNLTQIDIRYLCGRCPSLTKARIEPDVIELGYAYTSNPNTFSGCSKLTDLYVGWADDEVYGQPWGATNAKITFGVTRIDARKLYAIDFQFSFYTPNDVATVYLKTPSGEVIEISPDGSDFPSDICEEGVISSSDSYTEEDGTMYVGYYWETATYRFPELGGYVLWGESGDGTKSQKYRIYVET